uniref:PAN domain-containing protein n=1 Tax=Globodera rostochiensis TaxID=31243 RepID=A0A914I438_GLORO
MPNNALRHSSSLLLYLWWLTVAGTERAQMRIGADGNGERTRHFLEIIGKADNGGQITPAENVQAEADKFVVGEEEEEPQCPHRERSVFIEHLRPFVGRLIGKSPMEMPSVDECAKRCTQVPNCAGANFLMDLNGEPICTLHSAVSAGAEAESPLEAMFGLRRFCLRRDPFDPIGRVCSAPWTFQKFARIRPIEMSPEFLLENGAAERNYSAIYSLDECLQQCHRNPNCAGALYSQRERRCRLSKVSPQNVHGIRAHFRHDAEWDLYELNCIRGPLNPTRCAFHRIRHAGFTSPFTVLLHGVASAEECQSACMAFLQALSLGQTRQTTTICRAWTHHASSSRCFLSHLALRSLGRSVLEQMDPELSSGEVDECMDFKLDCHAHSLTLSGFSPLKLFRGHVQPKRAAAAANCAQLRIDSAVHAFRVNLPFTRCAFEKSSGEQYTRHTNTLMIKEASTELITARDKTVQVNCYLRRKPFAAVVTPSTIATNFGGPPLLNVRFRTVHNNTDDDDDEAEQHVEAGAVPKAVHAPQQQQMLSTRVLLVPSSSPSAEDDDGAKRRLRGGQRQQSEGPAYRLEVLDASGLPVQQKVELGKPGFLEIRRRVFAEEHKFDGDNDGSLLLSDLKAMDSANVANAVPLIDSDGCVTNASMVTSIQRMDANRIRIGIRFSGFGDKARVAYQGIVKRCEFGCLLDCNRHFYIGAQQLSDSEAANFGTDAQNVPSSAAGGDQNPAAQFKSLTAPDGGVDTESNDQHQQDYATDGQLPFLVDNMFGTGTPPTPLRLHRRAIPMPAEGAERPNRHFQLRDDIWEVRTHGMEAVVVNGTGRDEAPVDDKENFRPLKKQMFACLRDISVLLAALQAVLLLVCAYLLYVRLSFWLLNVNLAASAFLRRFIAAFARVQPPSQRQQPSPEAISVQRPHERTEIIGNLNPNLALKQ